MADEKPNKQKPNVVVSNCGWIAAVGSHNKVTIKNPRIRTARSFFFFALQN